MVDFIKSNSRVFSGCFACLIALMLVMACMCPVAFAAEVEDIEIESIDFSEFPFTELPAERSLYWITIGSDGNYIYLGGNSSAISINLIKGAISSATYAGSVDGGTWCSYTYKDGQWVNNNISASGTYNWFPINDVANIKYCTVPVYIKDGEDLTLVYPKPKDVGSVLDSFAGLSGLYWRLASGFLLFCASEPLVVFGLGLAILSIIVVFVVKRVRGI